MLRMQNGGLMPSCFVCKWKKELTGGEDPLLKQIHCEKNGFDVLLPTFHFCSSIDGYTGLRDFSAREKIEPDTVYVWAEVSYRTSLYPTLPQYYHEYAKLAPFSEYTKWTDDQKRQAFQSIHNTVQKKLRENYSDTDSSM